MPKLSKTSLLVVLTGVMLIAFVALGMTYSQHSRQQTRLNQELDLAQTLLKKTASDYAGDKQRLQDAMLKTARELDAVKAALSPGNESIEACDRLFRIADETKVRIVDIASAAPTRDKVSGTTFSALSLAVRVRGQTADILRFISTWTEQNTTGMVKSVAITRSRSGPSDNVTSSVSDNVSRSVSDNVSGGDGITDNLTDLDGVLLELLGDPGALTATINIIVYTYQGN